MQISRGDVVTVQGYPQDYPLQVLSVIGGKVAIGSPWWPKGATRPVELHQIISINDRPVEFPKPQTNISKRRRKSAA